MPLGKLSAAALRQGLPHARIEAEPVIGGGERGGDRSYPPCAMIEVEPTAGYKALQVPPPTPQYARIEAEPVVGYGMLNWGGVGGDVLG